MRRFLLGLLCLGAGAAFTREELPVVTPTQLRQRLAQQGDTLVVVNFWATWCRPCIEELPAFDSLARRYRSAPVRVWLVNVDFPSQWERRVKPFLRRRRLTAPVMLLNYGRGTQWLDTLSAEWSGSLPATLFWRASDSLAFLHEGELTLDSLQWYVQRFWQHR